MNTARQFLAGCGIQTTALAFGGSSPPITALQSATEEFNGGTVTVAVPVSQS